MTFKSLKIFGLILVLGLSLFDISKTYATGSSAPSEANSAQLSPEAREYYLKGAFLRYAAQFIEWPTTAIPKDVVNLCLLGQVPYFQGINSINGKVVNDHTITILQKDDVNAVKNQCQLVFVTKTEQDHVKDILATLKGLPILTFGDMDNFSPEGGAMNFYIANNKLAIMANLKVMDAAHLKVNPRMLKLITVVPNV